MKSCRKGGDQCWPGLKSWATQEGHQRAAMRLPAGPFLPLSLKGGLLAASPPSSQLQSSFFSSYPGGDVTPQGPGPRRGPANSLWLVKRLHLALTWREKHFTVQSLENVWRLLWAVSPVVSSAAGGWGPWRLSAVSQWEAGGLGIPLRCGACPWGAVEAPSPLGTAPLRLPTSVSWEEEEVPASGPQDFGAGSADLGNRVGLGRRT